MTIPKGEIDRLGDRLRESVTPSREDLIALQKVSDLFSEPLESVVAAIQAAGYRPTTRHPKTIGTLLDKLRRERTTRLSQIQDIAGARVVIDGGRTAQDIAVRAIRAHLLAIPDCECPRPSDRRENPSHGYRAVHLIPRIGGLRVEIQIRTELQDGWANQMEKWADVYGRQIRYGGAPNDPDTHLLTDDLPGLTPRWLTDSLLELSDEIAEYESQEVRIRALVREGLDFEIPETIEDQIDQLIEENIRERLQPQRDDLLNRMAVRERLLGLIEEMKGVEEGEEE